MVKVHSIKVQGRFFIVAVSGVGTVNTIVMPNFSASDKLANDGSTVSFGDYLNTALNQVNDLQNAAQTASNDFAVGNTDNIQSVMIAGQKADLSLQFTMQVRNKILDAYNEIMRMQI